MALSLSMMFLLPLAGIILNLVFIKVDLIKKFVAFASMGAIVYFNVLLFKEVGHKFELMIPFVVLNQILTFKVTYLNLYFSIMISSITFLTVLFSLRFMTGQKKSFLYYIWLFVKTLGMFGLIFANDFLTFLIMWEIMSWGTFFLMMQGGGKALVSAYKYLIYAITASMILIAGIVILYFKFGSFDFGLISLGFSGLPLGISLLIAVVFILSFSIESAVFPLHSWVPEGYSNTFSPLTSYFSAISTRIGIYGLILFLFGIVGLSTLDSFNIFGKINLRFILGIFAALTMIVPTYTALFQDDAKKLVVWSSIGQGGYILVGLISGTSQGIAGGMMHIVNMLTYEAVILFSIAAVEYRTGTTNLNKLGGLIKRQPIAYIGVLVGIIGLAGIPPMNGFVSKWFIYRALILGGHPFLAIAAIIGTLGTILAVYKLIHNIFLGQLPERYNKIKEVPFDMQLPIWILALGTFALGVFPGIAMSLIAKIQSSFGLIPVSYSLTGIKESAGQLNMLVVTAVFFGGMAVAYLVYIMGNKRKHVSQYDNYAAGHSLDKNVKYNFNYKFYAAFEHIVGPYRKKIIDRTEHSIIDTTKSIGGYFRRIYTGNINTYASYIVAAFVIVGVLLLGLF